MFQEFICKKNSTVLNQATLYFCKQLGLTVEEMDMITVQEVSKLDPGTSGLCTGIYVKEQLQKVEIKLLSHASIYGLIDVLAHELVHARQHVRGEFEFVKVKYPIFLGLMNITVTEKYHKRQRLLKTPYYDRLCEIEAHILAHTLTLGFCNMLYKSQEKETDSILECIYAPI